MTSRGDARRALALVIVFLIAAALPAQAVQTTTPPQAVDRPAQRAQDLRRLSIEELASVDITTASRRPEPLLDIAAAVSVVRSDEIRRSGATSLPEAIGETVRWYQAQAAEQNRHRASNAAIVP